MQLQAPVKLLPILLLVDEAQVFVSQNLALAFAYLLLLILDLLSSQVIILDERIVGHRLILLITFGMLILLVDQLFVDLNSHIGFGFLGSFCDHNF